MIQIRISFVFILIGLAFHGFSQEDTSFASPQAAVTHHLSYLQPDSYDPSNAARAFRFSADRPIEKRRQIAIKLKQIYDVKGWFIDIEEIPDAVASDSTGIEEYTVIEGENTFKLVKKKDGWKYSAQTIHEIPGYHQNLFPAGSSILMNLIPQNSHLKWGPMYRWQWWGLLIIFALATVVFLVLKPLISWFLNQFLRQRLTVARDPEETRRLSRTLAIWLALSVFKIFIPVLLLPVKVNHFLITGISIATTLLILLVFYRLIQFGARYFERLAEKTETRMDDQLIPLVVIILKILLFAVGIVLILSELDVDVTGLIAGLSIGGLALALAAQDTLKNFLGSMMIFMDKPFQIGDWISAGEVDGTVEEVGFRSTRVRTFRDSLMYIPNGKLADMITDNHGMRTYRRFNTRITITYDTPTSAIKVFIKGLRKMVEDHPHVVDENYKIYLNGMGSSSLEILFYIFIQAENWDKELEYKEEVLLAILELAESLQIRFAFPTQTLHIEDLPGQDSLTPASLDSETLNQRLNEFFENRAR
jgi:MscS family membrane protein